MARPPTVPWPILATAYLDAVEKGLNPGVVCRAKFGLTEKQWEVRRTRMSRHNWLPRGFVTDVPAARELLRRKMRYIPAPPSQLRLDAEAAVAAKRARIREARQQQSLSGSLPPPAMLKIRRTSPANTPAQRSPVLDLFL